jgi:hypothetical protein
LGRIDIVRREAKRKKPHQLLRESGAESLVTFVCIPKLELGNEEHF